MCAVCVLLLLPAGALHASTGPQEPSGPQYLRWQPDGSAADLAQLSDLEQQLLLEGAAQCGLEVHGAYLDFSTAEAVSRTAEAVIQLVLEKAQEVSSASTLAILVGGGWVLMHDGLLAAESD